MPELGFPFLAMWLCLFKMHAGVEVCQFVYKCYEKTIWVEINVQADAVMRLVLRRLAVIAQYALTFMCKRKVYGMRPEIGSDKVKGIGR